MGRFSKNSGILNYARPTDCVICLIPGVAKDGINPGINSPLTTTIYNYAKEFVTGCPDGTLFNFAGTTASGYDGNNSSASPYRIVGDGVDDTLTIPHNANQAMGVNFTIEMIVRVSENWGDEPAATLIRFIKPNTFFAAWEGFSDSWFGGFYSGAQKSVGTTGADPLTAGSVYHLFIHFNGADLKLEVNGVLRGTADHTGFIPTSTTSPVEVNFDRGKAWELVACRYYPTVCLSDAERQVNYDNGYLLTRQLNKRFHLGFGLGF